MSMVGRVRTILVFDQGDPVAVPATVVATRRTSSRQRLCQAGPGRFDPKTLRHIRSVVLPVADRVLACLQADESCYDLSIPNMGVASAWDTNVEVSGFSADLAVLLACVCASSGVNVPDDVAVTGHLASTDGDASLVCHLPEKVEAAAQDPAIRRFVYADGEADESLQAIAPEESARLVLAIRAARDRLHCVSVGNVEELLRAVLTEEDVLHAALRRGSATPSPGTEADGALARAALFLGGDMEDRFWEQLRCLLFSGSILRAKSLLLAKARSCLHAEEYPAHFGGRVATLVRSAPSHVVAKSGIFPLLPTAVCLGLLRLAPGSEEGDAVLLLDATRNLTDCGTDAGRNATNSDNDTGSPEAVLSDIVSELGATGLANSVTRPIDEARATFPLDHVVVSSQEAVLDVVARYYRHLTCHCDKAIYAEPHDVAAAGLDLVRRAFESMGGLRAAIDEANVATRGGMRAVLDQMTEQFRQERVGMHVQAVLARRTSHLSWEEKVALVRLVQDSVGPQLSPDLRMRRPDELAATCEQVLRKYVQVVNRWHTEMPFMIDRR